MLKSISAKATLVSNIHITLFNTKKATICTKKPSQTKNLYGKTIIQKIFIKTIVVINQIIKHKTKIITHCYIYSHKQLPITIYT